MTLLLPAIYCRGENPMCFVCDRCTYVSAITAEVKTPSKRCTESPIGSTLRTVFRRENRKKPQNTMSNLFLIRLSCSTILAFLPRRLCGEMSESRWRPVIAPDAVLGSRFNTEGRGRDIIVAENRSISHTPITSKNHARSQATTRFDAIFTS